MYSLIGVQDWLLSRGQRKCGVSVLRGLETKMPDPWPARKLRCSRAAVPVCACFQTNFIFTVTTVDLNTEKYLKTFYFNALCSLWQILLRNRTAFLQHTVLDPQRFLVY